MTFEGPGPRLDLFLAALAAATGAATLIGGWFGLRFTRRLPIILGFSAGAVIGVALFDLLPEALELRGAATGAIANSGTVVTACAAAGFLGYLTLDRAVLMAGGGGVGHRGHLGAAGLTLHSLLDGLAIGLGFQVSAAAGLVLALAVLAHDFSDGLNTVTVSLAGSAGERAARRWLLADAIAPAVGIAAGRLIEVPGATLSLILAAFSGFFLYVGACELLPESHRRHPRMGTTAATLAGAALIWLVVRLASP
jgi:ZIP family zinc transporter